MRDDNEKCHQRNIVASHRSITNSYAIRSSNARLPSNSRSVAHRNYTILPLPPNFRRGTKKGARNNPIVVSLTPSPPLFAGNVWKWEGTLAKKKDSPQLPPFFLRSDGIVPSKTMLNAVKVPSQPEIYLKLEKGVF